MGETHTYIVNYISRKHLMSCRLISHIKITNCILGPGSHVSLWYVLSAYKFLQIRLFHLRQLKKFRVKVPSSKAFSLNPLQSGLASRHTLQENNYSALLIEHAASLVYLWHHWNYFTANEQHTLCLPATCPGRHYRTYRQTSWTLNVLYVGICSKEPH